MATERQIQETIARCVGITVFYHNGAITANVRAMRALEYKTVAGRVKELGLSHEATEERILRPVEAELIARYGPEEGRRLNVEFLKAFAGVTVPIPCPAT